MTTLRRITDLPLAAALTGNEIIEISQPSATVTRTATTISAQTSDNSFNDSANGFITAGFAVGDRVRVIGFTGNAANNLFAAFVTSLTAGKMVIGGTDGDVIVDDAAGESVTISKWTSRRLNLTGLPSSGGGGGTALAINTQGGAYTPALTDAGALVRMASGAPVAFTVPPDADVAFPVGSVIQVRQAGGGQVTFVAAAGVTINSAETLKLRKQGSTGALIKIAANTWDLTGDLELL